MARYSFGNKAGRVRVRTVADKTSKSGDELVRDLKHSQRKPKGEDYRERSLTIHGLVCARCGREFDPKNRQLLTVHHKDGNHHNNPPDGSNWENLCVYCHEDAHSRAVLGQYVDGSAAGDERHLVYEDPGQEPSSASLGDLMRRALEKKQGKKGGGP